MLLGIKPKAATNTIFERGKEEARSMFTQTPQQMNVSQAEHMEAELKQSKKIPLEKSGCTNVGSGNLAGEVVWGDSSQITG